MLKVMEYTTTLCCLPLLCATRRHSGHHGYHGYSSDGYSSDENSNDGNSSESNDSDSKCSDSNCMFCNGDSDESSSEESTISHQVNVTCFSIVPTTVTMVTVVILVTCLLD